MGRLILHLALVSTMWLPGPAATAAGPPNVIIINTDDHAQWAVGAYGNREIHTPHMDRLAREGMRFDHAFTKPVCSPSRAMTLTGQYSHRLGIPDYIPYGNPVYADNGLPAGTPTIASVLKTAGYTSAAIGKWHLGYGEKYFPERFGFDVAEGHPYLAPGKQYASNGRMPVIIDGREVFEFSRGDRHTDVLIDRAIDFIRANRTKPFFVFLNAYVPHQPWSCAPEEDLAHYQDKPLTVPHLPPSQQAAVTPEELLRLLRLYYAHVTCADRNLGRLLAALGELGLAENTLVLFMGDNGFNVGQHGLLGKGNGTPFGAPNTARRPNMFDTSIFVPFIIRWPGVVKAGATSEAFVSTLDILPTLMEATGAGAGQKLQLDGRSLLPLLKGESVPWRDAYSDTYDMTYNTESHMRMIRTDRWKLVLHFDAVGNPLAGGSRHELYDLIQDPGELTNLFENRASATVREQLDTRLRTWMRETGVTAR